MFKRAGHGSRGWLKGPAQAHSKMMLLSLYVFIKYSMKIYITPWKSMQTLWYPRNTKTLIEYREHVAWFARQEHVKYCVAIDNHTIDCLNNNDIPIGSRLKRAKWAHCLTNGQSQQKISHVQLNANLNDQVNVNANARANVNVNANVHVDVHVDVQAKSNVNTNVHYRYVVITRFQKTSRY